MAVKLNRSNLQTEIYTYTWIRDNGDSPYAGLEDRRQVDKDEDTKSCIFWRSFSTSMAKPKLQIYMLLKMLFKQKNLERSLIGLRLDPM